MGVFKYSDVHLTCPQKVVQCYISKKSTKGENMGKKQRMLMPIQARRSRQIRRPRQVDET